MKIALSLILSLAFAPSICFADAPATTSTTSQPTTQSFGLPEPTRITLKLDNVPVNDAIVELFKQAGLPSPVSTGAVRTIDQAKVTLSLENEPFAVAVLELCRKIGMDPEMMFQPQRPFFPPVMRRVSTRPSTQASTRPASTRPAKPPANRRTPWVMGPSMTSGPFVFVARGARRTSEQSLDQPGLQTNRALSLSLSMICDPKIKLHAIDSRLLIEEAEDENGQSLALPENENQSGNQPWPRSIQPFVRNVFPINASLTYPSGASRRIALLRGILRLSVIRKSDPVEIFGATGARQGRFKAGAMEVSIRDLGDGGGAIRLMMTVPFSFTGESPWEQVRSITRPELFDIESEVPCAIDANLQGQNNEGFQVMLIIRPATTVPRPGPPAAVKPRKIVWNVPTEVEDVAVPVEFKDLLLP